MYDDEQRGCLRCDDCGQRVPCSHENTVVNMRSYALMIWAPRLECADCNMPLKDPLMWGKDGATCDYPGHPEFDKYRAPHARA
jgi:hypothetical protein